MAWIYLSPHMDDVALSCGGLVWEQAQAGLAVDIWTICSGDPPPGRFSPFAIELHARWEITEMTAAQRRAEDAASAAILGARLRHLPLPDCIYRKNSEGEALYASEAAIFGPIHADESGLVRWLADEIARNLPAGARLVCPLSLGGHVDHRLTHAAAGLLGLPLWYYADYPYVLRFPDHLTGMQKAGWRENIFELTPAGLQAWVSSVAAHRSQISSFWPDWQSMNGAIRAYAGVPPVVRLWQAPPE